MSRFITAMSSNDTTTENGAVSHSTSGDNLLDYFAKCGSYRNRSQSAVDADMSRIFNEDPNKAMKLILYNRLITRKVNGTDSVQRGQGNKDEFIRCLVWLNNNRRDILIQNLYLIPQVGCWHDLWYDSPVTKLTFYPTQEEVYELVKLGMLDKDQRQLLAKFLPKIRSNSNCKNDRHYRLNDFARGLCRFLGWSEKDYRKFKSSPNNSAHLFQRQMCGKQWNKIDFKKIPGRAFFKMVKSGKDGKNVFQRHDLEKKLLSFLESQPTVKFTGYPFELYKQAKTSYNNLIQSRVYNKQFEQLLNVAKDSVPEEILKKGVFCALDTSGSMMANVDTNGTQAIDVCVGLGIYFSSLLSGPFKDNVIMFDSKSRMLQLKGNFCDKVKQISQQAIAWGSTNFQSVVDEIVRVRKANPEIPTSEYPKILLVVSDMQFNPCENLTNHQTAVNKLKSVGLEMEFIWWQVANCDKRAKDYTNKSNDSGVTMISGFDGSIITTILGGEIKDEVTGVIRKLTPTEQMNNCLNQEILNQVSV